MVLDEVEVFHDEDNPDAVLECLLTGSPDFDHQNKLIADLISGTETFIEAVEKIISNLD